MTNQGVSILIAFVGLAGTVLGAAIVTVIHWLISKRERVNQLRLAALEKRLAVHQEAYTLWIRLVFNIHDHQKVAKIANDCQEWWYENCLYLDPKSREAFNYAYHHAFRYDSIPREKKEEIFQQIFHTGKQIAAGVELPPIGEYEGKPLGKEISST